MINSLSVMIYRRLYIFALIITVSLLGIIKYYSFYYNVLRNEYIRILDQNIQRRYYAQLADYFDQRYKEFIAQQSLGCAQVVNVEQRSIKTASNKQHIKLRGGFKKENSVQKHTTMSRYGFLWPVERSNFWLSSKFGPRKKEDGNWGYHYGIDMASPRGTPVMAAAAGTIIEAAFSTGGYGKTVVIRHLHGSYETRYAHLDDIFVRIGQRVSQGHRIGAVGDTGFVRGENGGKNAYHLHFEVKKSGKYIDPLYVLT